MKLGEKLGLDMQQKSGWSGNPISWGISRADVAYWHEKTMSCLKNKMTPQEMQTLHESLPDKTKECMQEYTNIINNMAAKIYLKLKALPQYQLNK